MELEGLLLHSVDFDSNPVFSGIYEGISGETGDNIPAYEYDEDSGFFVRKEE